MLFSNRPALTAGGSRLASNDSAVGKRGVFPTRKLVFPSDIFPRESCALFTSSMYPGVRLKITSFVRLKGSLSAKIASTAPHSATY